MVKAKNFFEKHPVIFKKCLEVNKAINRKLGKFKIAENEISFDLIWPYLFGKTIPNVKQCAIELRLHREIVDSYNSGTPEVEEIVRVLEEVSSLKPVSYFEYQKINRRTRKLQNNDLISSYLKSTERVYYRVAIIDQLKVKPQEKKKIREKVKYFSAFLLFDDDVSDLESDIRKGKQTILTEFLLKGNKLREGISSMLQIIPDGKGVFEEYTKSFKLLYLI